MSLYGSLCFNVVHLDDLEISAAAGTSWNLRQAHGSVQLASLRSRGHQRWWGPVGRGGRPSWTIVESDWIISHNGRQTVPQQSLNIVNMFKQNIMQTCCRHVQALNRIGMFCHVPLTGHHSIWTLSAVSSGANERLLENLDQCGGRITMLRCSKKWTDAHEDSLGLESYRRQGLHFWRHVRYCDVVGGCGWWYWASDVTMLVFVRSGWPTLLTDPEMLHILFHIASCVKFPRGWAILRMFKATRHQVVQSATRPSLTESNTTVAVAWRRWKKVEVYARYSKGEVWPNRAEKSSLFVCLGFCPWQARKKVQNCLKYLFRIPLHDMRRPVHQPACLITKNPLSSLVWIKHALVGRRGSCAAHAQNDAEGPQHFVFQSVSDAEPGRIHVASVYSGKLLLWKGLWELYRAAPKFHDSACNGSTKILHHKFRF